MNNPIVPVTAKRRRRYSARRITSMSFLELPLSSAIKSTLELRPSQLKVVNFLLHSQENNGIALVTSFGKTVTDIQFIDIIWQLERARSLPLSVFLFLVRTVGLARQVAKDMRHFRTFHRGDIALLAGLKPQQRQRFYESKALLYVSTPEGISNDLKNNRLAHDFFDIPILDEVHHAVKNYAYVQIIRLIKPHTAKIISQTATPPPLKKRPQVNSDLNLAGWYTIPLEEQLAWQYPIDRLCPDIPLPDTWLQILSDMKNVYNNYYGQLYEVMDKFDSQQNLLKPRPAFLFFSQLDKIREFILSFKHDKSFFPKAIHYWAAMFKQLELMHKLFQESFGNAIQYYQGLFAYDDYFGEHLFGSRADIKVYGDNQGIMAEIESIRQTALHPKIRLLLEIFERHQGEQIIIFCRYVETITVIRAYLKKYGFRAVFLVGQSHPELQTKKQAARALTRITKGQDSACVSSVANEGLNIFQRAHVAVLYSPPQSSIQLVQVEGRMGRTSVGDKIYNLLFGEFDRRKYWANFVGMGKILQGVNIIPERFTLHDPNFATLNLPASKGAYWSQDLVYCHGQLIRERFLCERVHDLGDQRGKRCITFNLRDKTGIINAHLYLDKRIMAHDEIERRVKYCYSAFSQIVVISGKVEVTLDDNLDLFNPAERLVTVHMHADQRQNVLICPSKYVLRDDYQN